MPALHALLLTRAFAQDCSHSTTLTVVSPTPAALASCTTFSGDIAIATSFSGEMTFQGVKTIVGTVYATDVASLEGLVMDDLESLDGLDLSSTSNFSYISWGGSTDYASIKTFNWTDVAGTTELDFQNFAGDSAVSFDSCSDLETFNISSPKPNSGLTSLSFTNNPKLGSLLIPNWAVDQSVQITQNDMMEAVDFPYMTRVGEDVIIRGNANMTSIALPSMTTIAGDFRISAGHSVYLDVSNSALRSIGGDVVFEGDVSWSFDTDISINGSFILSYSDLDGDQYTCNDEDLDPGKFTITCNGQIITPSYQTATSSATAGRGANAAGGSHTATPSATASSSSGLTTGAKIGIGVGISLGVIGIVSTIAAVVLLLRLRKKRAAAAADAQHGTELEEGKLPPPYSGLWRSRSEKKNKSDGSNGSAEPMFPERQEQGGTAELEGDQRPSAGAQVAELESPRPEQQRFIAPVEMEGDQNWRRSELMGDTARIS